MTKSAEIQRTVLTLLSDGAQHTVQEMKATLAQDGISEYTEGQFAGSLNTLIRNGSIKKNNRGIYSIETRSEKMMTCFVVPLLAKTEAPHELTQISYSNISSNPSARSVDLML